MGILVLFLSIANKLSENIFVDSFDLTLNNCFLLALLQVWYLYVISIVFPKTALFTCLEKSFSKSFFAFFLSSVFISMYVFNKASWLNLISLLWILIYLWILICMTYFFYHASWLQVFQLFQFSLFQIKRVNQYGVHVIFQDTEHHLQANIFHHYLLL